MSRTVASWVKKASAYARGFGSMPLQLTGMRITFHPSCSMRVATSSVKGGTVSSGTRPSSNVTSKSTGTFALYPRNRSCRPRPSRNVVPTTWTASGSVRAAPCARAAGACDPHDTPADAAQSEQTEKQTEKSATPTRRIEPAYGSTHAPR
jgi:hypothetical protein